MKKSFKFSIKGVATKDELKELIEEMNNCEFCNKYTFI
ncbi:Hsp33 family molecular chaperone HslO (plasmid) [Clostridium beijerinckii]|nr:Hsp33 family molecular chaperone HslO [Clostridium beijerinckii]UYZ39080.1 Hsp33 family molecular chaperone HslO [Clostridium beijerinckii]